MGQWNYLLIKLYVASTSIKNKGEWLASGICMHRQVGDLIKRERLADFGMGQPKRGSHMWSERFRGGLGKIEHGAFSVGRQRLWQDPAKRNNLFQPRMLGKAIDLTLELARVDVQPLSFRNP